MRSISINYHLFVLFAASGSLLDCWLMVQSARLGIIIDSLIIYWPLKWIDSIPRPLHCFAIYRHTIIKRERASSHKIPFCADDRTWTHRKNVPFHPLPDKSHLIYLLNHRLGLRFPSWLIRWQRPDKFNKPPVKWFSEVYSLWAS